MRKSRRNRATAEVVADELSGSLSTPTDDGLSLEEMTEADGDAAAVDVETYEPACEGDSESIGADTSPDIMDTALRPDGDDDPDAGCPISPASIVEAILFVGDQENRPISARQMASLMRGVRSSEVELIVEELNETYTAEECPYRIEPSAGGYRLVLLEQFAALRENFYGRVREAKLNQPSIEVLAMIAYQQPIDRSDLNDKCDEAQRRAVRQLVRRGLVAAVKDAAEKGRVSYSTTPRFLTMFNLSSLADLPQPHDLEQH